MWRMGAVLITGVEPTMLTRLDDPRRENGFGRAPDERALLRRWLPGFHTRCPARSARPVDAARPPNPVAGAVLSAASGVVAGR